MASALHRLDRHLEVISTCDVGLTLLPWASGDASQTREQERLLLRRAGCFLVLEQPAQALSDYRSARRINPKSVGAASGVQEAWDKLQRAHRHNSLYHVLGCEQGAPEEELKRAYRKLALRWHPDKHAQSDEATCAQAEVQFKLLQDAWTVLSQPESRASYDAELSEQTSST